MAQEMVLWLQLPAACVKPFGSAFPSVSSGNPQADGVYATASSSRLRLTNKLTSAQVTNSRCAFFFSPR